MWPCGRIRVLLLLFPYSQPVPVRVRQFHLAPPRFIGNADAEFGSDPVEVTDSEVGQRAGAPVPLVLREMKPDIATVEEQVEGKLRGETMFALYLEPEAGVPLRRLGSVLDAEDRDELFSHDKA